MPIVAIVGPTAIGKSQLAIRIAQTFGGEIISGDAMQFYKGLDIGTAKVTFENQQGILHHLIDILDTGATFSVQEYQQVVRAKITEIQRKHKLPILVGGSGLYLQAVLYDYRFLGTRRSDSQGEKLSEFTTDALYQQLEIKNPEYAKRIHPTNRRRIMRALEIVDENPLESLETGKNQFYADAIIIGLEAERRSLYQRIESRVDQMVTSGLVDEVKSIANQYPDAQAMQAIGYKEFLPYFRQETSLETAIEAVKLHSRRYAKRQLTWFHNQMDVTWFEVDLNEPESVHEKVIEWLQKSVEK